MIAIIAAMNKDRVIGVDNKLPWNIPEDLKQFRERTSGNTVVMGRKTFDSIGKPLPNRNNVVISRTSPDIYGASVCRDIEEGLKKAQSYGKDVYIIGGATIYKQMMRFADTMFISYVNKKAAGDTYFPEIDESEWKIEKREKFQDFELVKYVRFQSPNDL